jgi:rhodanese-related sulfurtransferase
MPASHPHAHRLLGAIAIGLGLAAAAAGEPARNGGRIDLGALAAAVENEQDHVSAPALATWIRARRPGLTVIDLQPASAFEQLHIPTAVNMTVTQAAAVDAPLDSPIVIYSEGGTHAAQVWFMLRARGYRRVYFLREGLYEWVSRVLDPMLAIDATPAEEAAYDEAAEMARYFGGRPRRNVPRDQIPDGYWLHEHGHDADRAGKSDAIDNVRRRGC